MAIPLKIDSLGRGIPPKLWGMSVEIWPEHWASWPWATTIQGDLGVCAGINADVISTIGDVSRVLENLITSAQYKARWQQLAQWCLDRKIWLYPSLVTGDACTTNYTGSGITRNYTQTEIVSTAMLAVEAVDAFPNVIGYLLFDEIERFPGAGYTGDLVALAAALQTGLRARSAKAGSFSRILPSVAVAQDSWNIYPYCDFLDGHMFSRDTWTTTATPVDAQIPIAWAAAHPGMDMWFSEFSVLYGTSDALTGQLLSAWFSALDQPYVRGGMYWPASDRAYEAIGQLPPAVPAGMFLLDYTPWPACLQAFRRGQGTASLPARRYLRMVRDMGAVEWSVVPVANWTADRLYKDGSKVYEGSLSRYIDGAGLTGLYEACAFDGTSEGSRIKLQASMDEARLVLNVAGGRR